MIQSGSNLRLVEKVETNPILVVASGSFLH